MQAQLHLLPSGAQSSPTKPLDTPPAGSPETWRLDERTRDLGRRGVAQAKAALREARRKRSTGEATAA